MMFAFGTLFLVEGSEFGIMEGGDGGSLEQRSAQIRRTALGHTVVGGFGLAGVGDGSVNPGIGDQLGGRREARNITDFTEDDRAEDRANAGDGGNGRGQLVHQDFDLLLSIGDLLLNELHLLQKDAQLEGETVPAEGNTEGVGGSTGETLGGILAALLAAEALEQFGELFNGNTLQIGGRVVGE